MFMELLSCEKRKTGHWSSVPGDILLLIAGKIGSTDDYVRFSATCRSWYFHATDFYDNLNHKLNLVPLYVPGTLHDSKRITLRNPYSGTTLALHLPETAGTRRCWGSPFGWLIALDHSDLRVTISLVNPFTGAAIPLPDLPFCGQTRYDDLRFKAFLTANPESDPDDCLVVFSVSGEIAIARPGSESWSFSENRLDIFDVAYFNGNLYGVEFSIDVPIKLFLFEFNQTLTLTLIPRFRVVHVLTLDLTPPHDYTDPGKYLFVSNGELCLCIRCMRCICPKNSYYMCGLKTNYKVFKIDFSTGNLTQHRLLGGQSLFFSNNYSFASKINYLPVWPCQEERREYSEYIDNFTVSIIYFNGPGSISPSHPFDVEFWFLLGSLKRGCSPFWILPSIRFWKLKDNI